MLFVFSLCVDGLFNDWLLFVCYDGYYYFLIVKDYLEIEFGGDFLVKINYFDLYICVKIEVSGNFVIYLLNCYCYDMIDYFVLWLYFVLLLVSNWFGID